MIRAVFFDFYGTLAHWSPQAEEIQKVAAAAEDIEIDTGSIARAYLSANAYMDAENARIPIRDRSKDQRDRFFAEYEMLLLKQAGVEISLEEAARVWSRVQRAPKELVLYPDAADTLRDLANIPVVLGVISNMGTELDGWLERLGIDELVSVRASSANTGVNKPNVGIFSRALQWAGVRSEEALHVGDSVESDVEGARNAGIKPILVLRVEGLRPPEDVYVVRSLSAITEAVRRVVGGNELP